MPPKGGYSKELLEKITSDRWLNLNPNDKFTSVLKPTLEDKENPHLYLFKLFRKPENLYLTAKYVFGVDLALFQMVVLQEMYQHTFPMLIGSRGMSKSFLLAFYALWKCFINQGSQIVITASSFRQAKFVFTYAAKIFEKAKILQDLLNYRKGSNEKNGPKWDTDRCEMFIGESTIVAIPLGHDGGKIRGQRASTLIIDERATVPTDVVQRVLFGFAAVSQDPVEKMKRQARMDALKELGLWTPDMDDEESKLLKSNQSIVSGSAYYQFNDFYKEYKQYKEIITSRGDKTKMEELFGGEVPPGISHKDFCVIRLPYELLPKGFMDDKTISRAKATFSKSTYLMEYSACLTEDAKIITDTGLKNIIDINIGDLVLTHKGRFKPVIKKTYRKYDGDLYKFKNAGTNFELSCTPEHPFYINSQWVTAKNLDDKFELVNLRELNNNKFIKLDDYTDNFIVINDKIYASSSQRTLTHKQIAEIRKSKDPAAVLSKKYNVPRPIIYAAKKDIKNVPKGAVPREIKLDYDFGLIVGYYAAEGSVGAEGRSITFALDGHHDTKLEVYVEQLVTACERVFGIKPKKYKKDSVCGVTINNRILCDMIKKICPGIAYNKYIDPRILFSNKEFLRGVITGYWNGDGHLPSNKSTHIIAASTSLDLLTQIRLVLSYFGISCFIGRRYNPGFSYFRGKKYNTRQSYSLLIYSQNGERFRNIFYNQAIICDKKSKSVVNTGDSSVFTINNFDIEDYSGYVYNLEVEEDNSYSTINATIHNCFVGDSEGFFRRSTIESCVTHKPIILASGEKVKFSARIKGSQSCKYVYGIDPASEQDNFAIVILEVYEDHSRVVYCWTSRKDIHKKKIAAGLAIDQNFYYYCVSKIRELMTSFPCLRIGIDSQGGGNQIVDMMGDANLLKRGEQPLFEVIDKDKPKPTDPKHGLHIIEKVQFVKSDWTSEANHGLKSDLENKNILFPFLDVSELASSKALKEESRDGEFLEDCALEIEEMKDELAKIVITQTENGTERWDTPATKGEGGKKTRERKDRYSALLIANMVARSHRRAIAHAPPPYVPVGGDAAKTSKIISNNELYIGPEWFTRGVNNAKLYRSV